MALVFMGQSYKTNDGKQRVINTPYMTEIGEGEIYGHAAVRVVGTNDAVGAAFETVSEIQGIYSYLASAEILQVSSSSTLDVGGGAGALTIKVWGLDTNWAEIDDTITLNGTASVVTNKSFVRVFRAKVQTVGAGASATNAGIISIKDNADSVTLLKCLAGEGGNSDGLYPVPAGKKLLITKFRAGTSGSQDATVHLMCRPFGGAFVSEQEVSLKDGYAEISLDTGIQCTEKSDVELRATGSATAPSVSASFEGRIEDAD